MAVPAHTRVRWSGTLPLGEEWSFGLNLLPPSDPDESPSTWAANATAARNAYATALNDRIYQFVALTAVEVASIGADGHYQRYPDGSYRRGQWSGNLPGGNSFSGERLPMDAALCISLGSAFAGARGKGRFYIPILQQSLDNDTRLTEAAAGDWLFAAHAFLSAVSTNINTPVIASKYDALHPVNSIRCGRVIDVQRRRRNRAPEGYVYTAFP